VVIPSFNESDNIINTIEEIKDVIEKKIFSKKYEIIVTDDHSTDNTYQIVESFNDVRIKCIRLSRRSGSHIALRAGIANARGDAVLCISADGQDDPNVLEEMLKKLHEGAQIVWALRKKRKESFLIKRSVLIFYRTLELLTNTKKSEIDLSRADFYLLDKKVVDAINHCPERNTSLFGLINWLGFKQDYVEFERRKRKFGKSKWDFRKRLHLAKDWIIAFSGLPLKLMTIVGILVSIIGFLYAIDIIISAIRGITVPGWASIMVVILILGGFQMIMFGIVGEYLWRNLEESRRRPLYFIEKTTFKKLEE
jgi:dolichol-phosphate mannosyltransferase